jgi:predicted O-methyltransferase YrrM
MTYTYSKNEATSGLTHIRPGQLLSIPDNFGEEIKFFMPPAQGAGSLTTLESVILLKLLRCVNPSFVFEFGTYKGYTTRLLLENLPERNVDADRIYTLDLPEIDNVVFQGDDRTLAAEALGFQRKYLTSQKKNLVKQIFQDSMTLDPQQYLKKFQYIFIDANHEASYARKDTENALKMLSDSPACIIWHDYGNAQFPELTQYLEGLSDGLRLYHVEGTMLVFHLLGVEIPGRNT